MSCTYIVHTLGFCVLQIVSTVCDRKHLLHSAKQVVPITCVLSIYKYRNPIKYVVLHVGTLFRSLDKYRHNCLRRFKPRFDHHYKGTVNIMTVLPNILIPVQCVLCDRSWWQFCFRRCFPHTATGPKRCKGVPGYVQGCQLGFWAWGKVTVLKSY